VDKKQLRLATTDQRGLTLPERKANLRMIAPRYKQATKKEKIKILDEFTLNNSYNRSYAAYVLRIYHLKAAVFH
jgi:hypothetical protein